MKFSFVDAISKIASTTAGREATMYGPLRDLFIQVLGYPASNVDIDTIGEEGRPDITIKAPSGMLAADNTPANVSWIVLEAKSAPGCFLDPDRRLLSERRAHA